MTALVWGCAIEFPLRVRGAPCVSVCGMLFVYMRFVSFTGDQSRLSTQPFPCHPLITAHYLL